MTRKVAEGVPMGHYFNEQRVLPVRKFHPNKDGTVFDYLFQTAPGHCHHFWLRTGATAPELVLPLGKAVRLTPQRVIEGPAGTYVLGATEAIRHGWSEVQLHGLTREDAEDTVLVISRDRAIEDEVFAAAGTLDELERALWGFSRADAGQTRLDPDTVEAGSESHFRFTYTPARALPAGAWLRFIVIKTFYDPGRGHVLTVEKGRDKLVYDHAVAKPNAVVFRVAHEVEAGESIVLRLDADTGLAHPCRADDDEMEWWYSRLPVFTAGVSVDDERNYVSPTKDKTHALTVVPGAPVNLHLFLPGRRHEGSSLEARGLITDRYRNAADREAPSLGSSELRLLRDGVVVEHLGALSAFRKTVSRFRIPLPALTRGVHRLLACDPETGREVARSNPLEIIAPDAGPEIYWGGLHCHTGITDGIGTMDQVYDRARYEGALDFAAMCEHAVYFTYNEWEHIQDKTLGENEDGRFVTLNAFEWGASHPSDKVPLLYHVNVFGRERMRKLTWYTNLEQGFEKLKNEYNDVFCQIHHAGRLILDVWNGRGADELIRLWEICSTFGRYERSSKPEGGARGYAVDLLAEGHKVGFMGGGDSHCGYAAFGPKVPPEDVGRLAVAGFQQIRSFATGSTAALADRLDQEHVLHALGSRKCYATTGARILLDFSVSGIAMGEEGEAESIRIVCPIHAVSRMRKIVVIRDGDILFERHLSDVDHLFDWRDTTVTPGDHTYFLRVEQEDDELAWTTPVWVKVTG